MISRGLEAFPRGTRGPLVFILGANEIASAVGVYLRRAGWSVILSHDSFPPVIRRKMAFHDVLFGDQVEIEGIEGELVETPHALPAVFAKPECVAVTQLLLTDIVVSFGLDLLIDARMQKRRVTPDLRHLARLTIGLGPKFQVGSNCDVAIETLPARTGDIVECGETEPADGTPRQLGGAGRERFVYAQQGGLWHAPVDIGARVYQRTTIGLLDGRPTQAPIDGVVRGIARDGARIPAGVKLLEIDPRGREASFSGIDERGHDIARATLRAVDLKASEWRVENVKMFTFRD